MSQPIDQVQTYRCGATLAPGQVRRVPTDPKYLVVAYWLCCPSCGAPNTISVLDGPGTTYRFEERDGNLITLSPPVPCNRCEAGLAVRDGAWQVTPKGATP